MMKAWPSSTFKMTETELLLEFLIVTLPAPAQFGRVDQIAERNAFWQGRQPVFGRRILSLGPFDQQPLFCRLLSLFMARCNVNPYAGKPRAEPCFRTQPEGKLFDRDRIRRIPAALLRGTARPYARRPHQGLRLYSCRIGLPESCDAGAQFGVVAVARVQ